MGRSLCSIILAGAITLVAAGPATGRVPRNVSAVDTAREGRVTGEAARPAPRPDPSIRAARTARTSTVWDRLAACESGGDWSEGDGGMGPFRGGLQWHPDTWAKVAPPGAPADPAAANRSQEIAAGEHLMAQPWGGWHHWPVCSRKVGLR